jgi:hypothetical protein
MTDADHVRVGLIRRFRQREDADLAFLLRLLDAAEAELARWQAATGMKLDTAEANAAAEHPQDRELLDK